MIKGKPYQRNFLKFETKKYFYDCKLCFTKVKHNKATIQSHLAANHDGMKLSAYEECFHPKVSNDSVSNGTSNGSVLSNSSSSNNTVSTSSECSHFLLSLCFLVKKVCL